MFRKTLLLLPFFLAAALAWASDDAPAPAFENIFEAVKKGTVDDVRHFVDHGADIHAKDRDKQTPLHYAIIHRKNDVMEYLLDRGANADAKALHIAVESERSVAVVKTLIDHGADAGGKELLFHAVRYQETGLLKLLVENGANVNARNGHGETPLHIAAEHNFVGILKYLISQGANVKVLSDSYARGGQTPLEIAWMGEAKTILREAGATERSEFRDFFDAAAKGTADDVRFFLEHGANANDGLYDWHETVLHHAARNPDVGAMKVLIEYGADVNAVTDWGTPLDWAVKFNSNADEAVKILREAGGKSGKDE